MVSLAIARDVDAIARARKGLPGFLAAAIHRMKQATQDVGQRESWIVRQRFFRSLQHAGESMQVTVDRAVIGSHRSHRRAMNGVPERVVHDGSRYRTGIGRRNCGLKNRLATTAMISGVKPISALGCLKSSTLRSTATVSAA